MKHYDIAVIGAGSAGLVAALTANRRGARVAMIEKNKIGGECTHSGCIPSKTFIHSANMFHAMKHAESVGLPGVQTTQFEFANVMEHVDEVVQGIYEHEQPKVFRDAGIDVFIHHSGAEFISNKEIRIGDQVVRAEHTVISTGSSPKVVPIPTASGGTMVGAKIRSSTMRLPRNWAIPSARAVGRPITTEASVTPAAITALLNKASGTREREEKIRCQASRLHVLGTSWG